MNYPDLQQFSTLDFKTNPELLLLNDRAVSKILGVTTSTLATWRTTGRYDLPFIKVGRNVRYRLSDLLIFIEVNSVTSTPLLTGGRV